MSSKRNQQAGLTTVEYALIAALLAAGVIGGFTQLGNSIGSTVDDLATVIHSGSAPPNSGNSGSGSSGSGGSGGSGSGNSGSGGSGSGSSGSGGSGGSGSGDSGSGGSGGSGSGGSGSSSGISGSGGSGDSGAGGSGSGSGSSGSGNNARGYASAGSSGASDSGGSGSGNPGSGGSGSGNAGYGGYASDGSDTRTAGNGSTDYLAYVETNQSGLHTDYSGLPDPITEKNQVTQTNNVSEEPSSSGASTQKDTIWLWGTLVLLLLLATLYFIKRLISGKSDYDPDSANSR